MKSALFVDFDNVYSALRKLDLAAAEKFVRSPSAWMEWVVSALELPDHAPTDARRRVLVRRCYLNPQAYQRFRPSFNLAGFEIIDCPALTSEGKTSTDIHMVLDIVDLLQHEVRYDEFIVFSADADFTPVLRKLRRWDRRTTVLAVGFPSAAYRASADLLIDQDEFVRHALGLHEEIEAAGNPLPAAALDEAGAAVVAALPGSAGDEAGRSTAPGALDLAAVAALIVGEVAKAAQPVPCARLAALIAAHYGPLADDWNGKGSFRRFVDSLDLPGVAFNWRGSGGHAYDPTRHVLADEGAATGGSWEGEVELRALARQINEVTGVPLLSPARYRALFATIAADLAQQAFDPWETAKRVRDACRDAGQAVSRADVNFVLRGLLARGHDFGRGDNDASTLARKMANNVRSLCLREQMLIDSATDEAISRWIGGGQYA